MLRSELQPGTPAALPDGTPVTVVNLNRRSVTVADSSGRKFRTDPANLNAHEPADR